jgi:aminomethyltransferase
VHEALGARMIPFGGWIMPVQYTGIIEEHEAVRTCAGLFDLSHMGELEVAGAAAAADVQRLVTNDVGHLASGQALYTPMCQESGTIVDDLLVYRTGEDRYLLVVNASNIDKDREWIHARLSPGTRFADRSDETALLALQGPRAMELVERHFPGAGRLEPFHSDAFPFEGASALVARTGYTGEDGVEVFVPAANAISLWERLLSEPVKPIGLGARDTLRLEARLLLYGNDIDETTTPLEAGIGWTVKLDKGPFVGREALAMQKTRGLTRRLAGFRVTGRGVARHGHDVVHGGAIVGKVTSGAPAPSLDRQCVGLAYVPVALAVPGTRIAIRIRDRDVEAEVVKTPFYRRAQAGGGHG